MIDRFETYEGEVALAQRGHIRPGDAAARGIVSRFDSRADLETITMDNCSIYWQSGGHTWSTANPALFGAGRIQEAALYLNNQPREENEAMTEEREKTWDERAEELGRGAMESITEMVAALECDYDRLEELVENKEELDTDEQTELYELLAEAGDCTSEDEARERILADPLSLLVRSGWCALGEEMKPEEFELLLTTGGPAVRIIGELDGDQVKRPRLQVQNWGKPWTEYVPADKETLRKYCNVFYFGE